MLKLTRCSLAVAACFVAGEASATPATCTPNAGNIAASCQTMVVDTAGVSVVINPGVTVSANNNIGLWNKPGGSSTSIVNYGTLQSTDETLFNQGTITSLTNFGAITGGIHIYNQGPGTIGTLTNVGTITGFRSIYNTGTIGTVNNLQGGGSPLTITDGVLPQNYNIIINGSAAGGSYGKLLGTNSGGAMAFNIYGNTGTTLVTGVNASTVAIGRYTAVLSDISAANIANLANGKVSGTYAGYTWSLVPESTATIWDLIVAAAGSNRTLSTSVNASGFARGGNAAGALDHMFAGGSSGDTGVVAGAFGNLSGDQQTADAVRQTLPLLSGGVGQAESGMLTSVNQTVQARVEGLRGASAGGGFATDGHVWARPFASTASQHDRDGVAGYRADTGGVMFGADGAIGARSRVGVALAYARSRVDGNDPAANPRANVDMYTLVGYGTHGFGTANELFYQVDVGHNETRGSRAISFGGLTRSASASYASATAHAGIGVGHTFALSEATSFTPSLRVDYTMIHDDGYSESGAGALSLNVSSQNTQQLLLGTYGTLTQTLNRRSTLSFTLGGGYDALARRGSVTAAYAGAPGASFSTPGMGAAPWTMRAGAGYAYNFSNTREISVRYDAEARQSFTNQTVSLRVRQAF
ncbi:MAG TPA: autotransporter outer membrane beta-barrel domain-containing protein [Burkholderiales bacterium]